MCSRKFRKKIILVQIHLHTHTHKHTDESFTGWEKLWPLKEIKSILEKNMYGELKLQFLRNIIFMPVKFQKDTWQSFKRYWNPKQEEDEIWDRMSELHQKEIKKKKRCSSLQKWTYQRLDQGWPKDPTLHWVEIRLFCQDNPILTRSSWWQNRASPGAPGTARHQDLVLSLFFFGNFLFKRHTSSE